eukprot:1476320-Amphidinium_carterae.1
MVLTHMLLNTGSQLLSAFKHVPAEKATGKRALPERSLAEIDAASNSSTSLLHPVSNETNT